MQKFRGKKHPHFQPAKVRNIEKISNILVHLIFLLVEQMKNAFFPTREFEGR